MKSDLWGPVFEINIGCGDHFKTVSNSREALESLLTCWPEQGGKSFKAAKKACLAAMSGRQASLAASEAFRVAAIEAGILRSR